MSFSAGNSMQPITIGIHEGLFRSFNDFLQKYEDILAYNNLRSIRLNAGDADFWQKLRDIDYFVFRWGHTTSESQIARTILRIVENEYKIPCFPNQATCWHYDDKIRQYYMLMAHSFPIVDTYIFWDSTSALEWVRNATFPLVFKLRGGAGSANVVLVHNRADAVKLINKMFSMKGVLSYKIPLRNNLTHLRNITRLYGLRRYIAHKRGRLGAYGQDPYWQVHRDYVLFQRFLPDNEFDTRITVIGDRAFGFIRYVRAGDFRASGSGLIDYDTARVDTRCIEIAFRISKTMDFQCMAYDFIYNENDEPVIVEISYSFLDTAVHKCSGYWDQNLKWHSGHYWPQFCQLADLIQDVDLKQPP
jgi:glutathione synthase/RimK-type ligase-like ATP-grasp enzyme